MVYNNASPEVQAAIRVLYAPIAWLHNNTPLEGPLDAYVEFWEGLS
jgi:hypothetical protein